jgi:hypothetical protein
VEVTDEGLPAAFWDKVSLELETGCWLWTGARNGGGYGIFRHNRIAKSAHRLAFETLIHPIVDDRQVDHLCRQRHCVRPSHLELVTQRENLLRGVGFVAVNAVKTECIHGHPLVGDNVYIRKDTGGRQCKTCSRERARRYAQAK